MPHVGIKEIIASIEQIPGLTDTPLPASSTGLDSQTRRIYDFFLPPVVRPQHSNSEHRLFLIIHNIDSRALRATKAKGALSLLALNPRVHVVASVDHVHAQMVWSTAEAGARKHTHGEGNVNTDMPPTRGFAWAWHDMTTMQPYDAELAHVDLNRNGKKSRGGTVGERGITETAARHILASVNAKAKKLFVLLAKKQLRSLEDSGTESKNKELKHHAVLYDALFNAARTDFIATNDTSFTALLAEFRDHKLIILNAGGGGEGLWIPLKPEELRRVIASLVAE
jgi:origin recognition complex subunit 2